MYRRSQLHLVAVLILAVILLMSNSKVQAQNDATRLDDIEGHWAENTVTLLHHSEVITTVENNKFHPDEPINRLDFARWIVRSIGAEPSDDSVEFTDSEQIPPASKGEIARAVDLQLIQGYPDGSFRPDETVTRIQMATILGRILESVGEPVRPHILEVFDDESEIPDWGAPASAAVRRRLVIGREAYTTFAPLDPTTRAEAAEMLYRLINKLKDIDDEDETNPPELTRAKPIGKEHKVAGWYLGRDEYQGASYETVKTFGDAINMVIMSTGYGFQLDDDELQLSGYDSAFLFSQREQNDNQKVLVRITNSFDQDVSDRILNDRFKTTKALELIGEVLERGYDGVNINFEHVAPENRRALTLFMNKLWQQYGEEYLITMAVPATIDDNPAHGWSGAFDYKSLGQSVDYLMPMAYDKHWRDGKPGPVAPIDWIREVVQYTIDCVPEEKVLLGIPFYGYDWLDVNEPNAANPVHWEQAEDTAAEYRVEIEWCDDAKTPFYQYTSDDGEERIVYFENEQSLEAKLSVVADYNLAGAAFWRFGQESPRAWQTIRDTLD